MLVCVCMCKLKVEKKRKFLVFTKGKKRKILVFTRGMYVCVRATLTLVSFFLSFLNLLLMHLFIFLAVVTAMGAAEVRQTAAGAV